MSTPASNSYSELAQLQQGADTVANESLASTQRMVGLCQDTMDTGSKTLAELDTQGRQLNNIEHGMIQINEETKEAKKNLNKMMACCGCVLWPWRKSGQPKKDVVLWKGNVNENFIANEPDVKNKVTGTVPGSNGQIIQRITNDSREVEMEQNMKQITGMIGTFRNMAIDMGTTIESQNRQIDKIKDMAETNEIEVSDGIMLAEKVLKK